MHPDISRTTLLALVLLALRYEASWAVETIAPPPATAGDARVLLATPTQFDQVGRILAPVMINGRGPFNLLVDTGANSSTISSQLADELGLDYSASRGVMLNGVTGRARVPVISIDRLEAGALVLRDQQVPIVEPHVLADADGILGVAALTDKQLMVDFRHNRVSLGYSQRLPTHLIKVKAQRLPAGLLVTPVFVGRVRALAIIDTGAERTLGNRALQKALRQRHGEPTNVSVHGATDEVIDGVQVLIENIQMGEVRVSNSHVAFGDFHVFDIWDINHRPALLLGMDILGRVDLFVIDFRRLEIGFRS